MTPTPEQIAALAGAIRVLDMVWGLGPADRPGNADAADREYARAVLAALPDWTLVPTAEVERLRAVEAAWRELCPTALAGDAP